MKPPRSALALMILLVLLGMPLGALALAGVAVVSVGCSPAAQQAATPLLVAGCEELVGLVDANGREAGAVCSSLVALIGPEIAKLVGALGKGELAAHFVPLVVDGKAVGYLRADLATEGAAKAQAAVSAGAKK